MIRDIVRDPAFWAFMTALVGSIRWLARVFYLYRRDNITKKYQLEASIERLKTDNAFKILSELKEVVNKHELLICELNASVKEMSKTQVNMTGIMKTLSSQYIEFQNRMTNVSSGASLVMDKVKSIETEVLEMKSGNYFIRTKKS